ncbi:hypothetical protein AUC47_04930 [Microbacterium sp. SZ1]|uniref:hypothetical protein n=1 Tax=Microbacterium sp. SZ1 TaxID=1849736 RepID=UPI000BBB7342|nr:hypothetical protein [Microbacterium sp. SZ1]PCE13995.1 hypothetical protein AUC47_04930 [Microbacterium sp. SZ1]
MKWSSEPFPSTAAALAAVEALPVIEPAVGDLVRYKMPWRSQVITSETIYEVRAVTTDYDMHEYARSLGADLPPLIVTKYALVDAARPNDNSQRCWPIAGQPDMPIRFELVAEAPPVEVDLLGLLDLLGWTTP